MWCFFPGALLLQQLATAGRTSSRAKRHLQGKTDRGYRVHQQPGATLRQKPTARMEPAVKCIPLALIIACSFFTLFIASIHSLSKWWLTTCGEEERIYFLNKPFIFIAFIDNNVWKRKKSLTFYQKTLIHSKNPWSNSKNKNTHRSMLCVTESTPRRYFSRSYLTFVSTFWEVICMWCT